MKSRSVFENVYPMTFPYANSLAMARQENMNIQIMSKKGKFGKVFHNNEWLLNCKNCNELSSIQWMEKPQQLELDNKLLQ